VHDASTGFRRTTPETKRCADPDDRRSASISSERSGAYGCIVRSPTLTVVFPVLNAGTLWFANGVAYVVEVRAT
jgi:hypothetical protein